jgi:hypothetical protein
MPIYHQIPRRKQPPQKRAFSSALRTPEGRQPRAGIWGLLFVNSGAQVFPDFIPVMVGGYWPLLGDPNQDGVVNGLDVDPFVGHVSE